MGRSCSICTHPQHAAIEHDLAQEVPYRTIETRYTPKVSRAALSRHQGRCLGGKASAPEPEGLPQEAMPAVVTADNLSPLTAEEADLLTQHEAVIARGLQSFVEVGLALMEIRERKLYRAQFHTFEQYLDQRWHLGRSHGYRLMDAAEVMRDLSPIGDKIPLPTHKAQARELAAAPVDERPAVWEHAVKTAPAGKVTASHVKAVVRQHADIPRAKAISAPKPHPREAPRKSTRLDVQEGLVALLQRVPDKDAWALLLELANRLASYWYDHNVERHNTAVALSRRLSEATVDTSQEDPR